MTVCQNPTIVRNDETGTYDVKTAFSNESEPDYCRTD